MMGKQKILVVDDKRENLVTLRQVLREADADLVEATSGNEALAATLDHQFSLAILDVQMPQMSGYELATYLRQDENTRQIPIIFLTAHSDDELSVFKGYESGGIDYIVKPYDPAIMRGKVRQFLEMDLARSELRDHRDRLEAMVAERTQALHQEVMERRQAQQRVEHLNSVLRSIRRINQLIVRAEDPQTMVKEACLLLVEARGYTCTWIILGQPGAEIDLCTVARRKNHSPPGEHDLQLGYWPACHLRAAQAEDGIAVLDPENDCAACPIHAGRNSGPALVTYLQRGEKVMGLLGVCMEQGSTVDDEERSLLREVAGDIAFSLHDIRIEHQHDLFAEIVANSQEAMSLVDSQHRYLKVNPSYLRMVGKTLEQIEGHHVSEVMGDDLYQEFIKNKLESCLSGETVKFENWQEYPDGISRLVEVLYSPCRDPEGAIYASAAAIRDITDLRVTEKALQSSDEFLVETGRMARMGGWSVNRADMKIEWTEVIREIHEVPPDYVPTHETALTFYHEEDRPILIDALESAFGRGEPFDLELRFTSSKGKRLWVHTRCRPVMEGGKVVKLMGTFQDITERLRLREERSHLEEQMRQAQKMESIGRLAGGVAHDFNNMLSIITGYAEMATDEVEEQDPLRNHLEQILDAAMRSRDLTRQLLAFARRQTVNPRVIDLNAVLSKSQSMLGRLIGEDIDLRLMPAERLWPVKLDPAQIDQIIANLAVNARDAIHGVGSVIIETTNATLDEVFCSNHMGLEPGDYVLFTFSDTGTGMDRDTMEKVFEPFFTTKESEKGTGLGLSTVYGIVRQAGGLVNVYSEPGHGTTFRIYLPRCDQALEDEIIEEKQKQLHGSETLLVVEDEEQILDLCRQVLRRLGYKVISADQPGEALLLAEKHQDDIHLLITDVVMPSMNGKELMERLERIKPGVKVLYMSGYTANIIAHRGVLAERVEFLQKPFATKDLAKKVRLLLDRK